MKIAIYKTLLSCLILFFSAIDALAWTAGQKSIWPATELVGGGDALDGIAGVSIHASDLAVTISPARSVVYFHGVSTGSEAESDPTYIAPNDIGGGVTRWKFLGLKEVSDFGSSQVSAFLTTLLSADSFTGATNFGLKSQLGVTITGSDESVSLGGISNFTIDGKGGVSTSVTPAGKVYIGETGNTVYVMISSPDLLNAKSSQVIWANRTGYPYVITNASFSSPNSGVTCDLKAGASIFNTTFAINSGTTLFMGVPMSTIAGVSVYNKTFTSGTTTIDKDCPVVMRWGGGSAANWVEIVLGGYLQR